MADNTKDSKQAAKQDVPFWGVPVVLSTIMISSGVFVLLLAQSIKIFSSIGY